MKPKSIIKIETSVISHLTNHTSRDLVTAALKQLTTNWRGAKVAAKTVFKTGDLISIHSDQQVISTI